MSRSRVSLGLALLVLRGAPAPRPLHLIMKDGVVYTT